MTKVKPGINLRDLSQFLGVTVIGIPWKAATKVSQLKKKRKKETTKEKKGKNERRKEKITK